MQFGLGGKGFSFVFMSLFALCGLGCGQQANDDRTQNDRMQAADTSDKENDHGGWWCVEHGVPEEQCTLCSSKAADEFKAKGDWCEEHGRAESQCFICAPSRAEKFAALYEAKFGHKPPKPTE